jgi:hypothetical protein
VERGRLLAGDLLNLERGVLFPCPENVVKLGDR